MRVPRFRAALLALLAAGAVATAHEPVGEAATRPEPLKEVRFTQRLGVKVDPALALRDEQGREVTMGSYLGKGRPVVLALVYFRCTMLCSQVLSGLTASLRTLDLVPGRDFDVVVASFDPRESPADAAEKRDAFLERLGVPGAERGWHHLVGDERATRALAENVGFQAVRDGEEWAHASGIMVLTPDGTLARYLYGVDYAPRDLKLALVEASDGRIGSVVDELLLFCFHYDPVHGRYSAAVLNVVRLLALLTVAALGVFIWRTRRTEPVLEGGGLA